VKVIFCSTLCAASWGGSEELWSQTAAVLRRNGHDVFFSYPYREELPPQLNALRALGAQPAASPHRAPRKKPLRWLLPKKKRKASHPRSSRDQLQAWLRQEKPDLTVVSMSWHLDDVSMTSVCRSESIPYCLLIQAASTNHFLNGGHWESLRAAFSGAAKCFFVSEQNRDLMEANLGLDLSQSHIAVNPFCLNAEAVGPWPASNDPLRLACVGRIDFQSKGQDVLLQTLRRPKWRDRRFELTFFGADFGNMRQVQALIELYGLRHQVKLGGHVPDITQVWRIHHALVLPSRSEGNALAMIEAMLCGRVPIVTNVGRVAALIDDNISGFIAPAATVDLLDEALERAWQRRQEWRQIGAAAAANLRQRHSLRPAEDFADAILALATRRGSALTRAA
jgi:glycosyltransferase involved in cell wall biosynthesis